MHFEMHLLASDIFSFCYNHGINLEIDWVPRSLNDKADYLSKTVEYDDWEIVPEIFQLLDSRLDPHILSTVSPLFTTFKSQDSFLGSGIQVHLAWTHIFKPGKVKTVGWLYQSSSFLKCLSLSHSRAQGASVLPYWPSTPFWPLSVRNFWEFVIVYHFFVGPLSVRQGRNNNSLLGSPTWSGHIIADLQ